MALPDFVPIKNLLACHPEYSGGSITLHDDLYLGGDRFEARKSQYLRPRQFEMSGSHGGNAQRSARLRSAAYTPHAAGLLDFLVSACFQAEPAVIASGPEAKTTYYHSLNGDVDGAGKDLPELMRGRLLQAMLHGRSYLAIEFPESGDASALGDQKSAGALDACLCPLDACCVEDWEADAKGNLLWVRTHVVDRIRSGPLEPLGAERHTWSLITSEYVAEYVAVKEAGKPWDKEKATASLVAVRPHSLGTCPIIPVAIPQGLWVMRRLAPIALALFNREASLSWALDTSAYSLLVIKSQRELSKVVASEVSALHLDPTDSAEYPSPDPQHFAALSADCSRMKEDLFLAVQAMALQAASKDSNGRQSGVAKFRDYGSIYVLLSSFAAALRDALQRSLALVQSMRGDEDVTISIAGLDRFDVQSLDFRLGLIEKFLALPSVPPTAARWALADLSQSIAADAPAEVREQIRREAEGGGPSRPAQGGQDSPPPAGMAPVSQDKLGKLPLAIQQLSLAAARFTESGDHARAAKVAQRIDELLAEI